MYYYNTLTNESTWEKPEGYKGDASKASAQPKPLATQLIKGTDWSEVVCEDGKKYFYNTTSLVSPLPLLLACSSLGLSSVPRRPGDRIKGAHMVAGNFLDCAP